MLDPIIIAIVIFLVGWFYLYLKKDTKSGGQKGGTDRPYLNASIFSFLGLVVIAALIYTIILSSSGKLGHST